MNKPWLNVWTFIAYTLTEYIEKGECDVTPEEMEAWIFAGTVFKNLHGRGIRFPLFDISSVHFDEMAVILKQYDARRLAEKVGANTGFGMLQVCVLEAIQKFEWTKATHTTEK